ncbi:MAG: rhodanese-like domain-containing protein [Daejeonella sp.]
MIIKQFFDKGLAHSSYAIISENKMVVIDPARDPKPYYDFAQSNNSKITGVIETHPHADFVSSHLEIHTQTGATIYNSKLTGANYPHTAFDEGQTISLGKIKLKAINTPGHSPDSISILLIDENGNEHALFTGDTLFVGDVGRPDLRESAGNITSKKEDLARDMYHSTREKIMKLPENVLVYPAHGPGSLCGKSMSAELDSTIGKEIRENYALQPMGEDDFVKLLIRDQPFVPKYFGHDVNMNKMGAPSMAENIAAVPRGSADSVLDENVVVIDTRPEEEFKKGHLKNSVNIQEGGKFETWLGSIVSPEEEFYLIADTEENLESVIYKTAKIGYEKQIKLALLQPKNLPVKSDVFNLEEFKKDPGKFTIVDVRNQSEVKEGKIFESAISIPLPELRERVNEIPTDKPIVVHCAGGYRSAAGSSIIEQQMKNIEVLDMSEAVAEFSSH